VQIIGDGPLGSITVDATGLGDVRGYALHSRAGADLDPARDVADLVGHSGIVSVLRDLGLKDLYQGQTAIVTGEVDEDIEAYLRTSEQVPSALGCEVLVADDGQVLAAAGILVQALPGGEPDIVHEARQALRANALGAALRDGIRQARPLVERIYTTGQLEFMASRAPSVSAAAVP